MCDTRIIWFYSFVKLRAQVLQSRFYNTFEFQLKFILIFYRFYKL